MPRLMQAVFGTSLHVIGWSQVRHKIQSLAVMEIRGSGADQLGELFALGALGAFPDPDRTVHGLLTCCPSSAVAALSIDQAAPTGSR